MVELVDTRDLKSLEGNFVPVQVGSGHHFYKLNSNYFMELALGEAKQAVLEDEVPVGCIIVKDNNVIASAKMVHSIKLTNTTCGD